MQDKQVNILKETSDSLSITSEFEMGGWEKPKSGLLVTDLKF